MRTISSSAYCNHNGRVEEWGWEGESTEEEEEEEAAEEEEEIEVEAKEEEEEEEEMLHKHYSNHWEVELLKVLTTAVCNWFRQNEDIWSMCVSYGHKIWC